MVSLCMKPLRHLADLLSLSNAVCGVASCAFALAGRPDVSLLLLLGGAVCDGLDGACARRFGGTRFGVLADDFADAISYAIAPGVAIAATAHGKAGTFIGVAYALFTIARLVFFTLDKNNADPRRFRGLPSTVGALVVLSTAALMPGSPTIIAFAAGIVTALMVTFDAHYEHLGRSTLALAKRERGVVVAGFLSVLVFALVVGGQALAAACLAGAGAYLAWPSLQTFVASAKTAARSA